MASINSGNMTQKAPTVGAPRNEADCTMVEVEFKERVGNIAAGQRARIAEGVAEHYIAIGAAKLVKGGGKEPPATVEDRAMPAPKRGRPRKAR